MKLIAVTILILLVLGQTFSKWAVIMSFDLNREYIAKNLCENRDRPKLNCKGNCVLMKKMKEEEKQERNESTLKFEITSAYVCNNAEVFNAEPYNTADSFDIPTAFNTGKPVDRSFAIFHPPSA